MGAGLRLMERGHTCGRETTMQSSVSAMPAMPGTYSPSSHTCLCTSSCMSPDVCSMPGVCCCALDHTTLLHSGHTGAYLVPIRKPYRPPVPDQSKAVQVSHLGHGVVGMAHVGRLPDLPLLVARINELHAAQVGGQARAVQPEPTHVDHSF